MFKVREVQKPPIPIIVEEMLLKWGAASTLVVLNQMQAGSEEFRVGYQDFRLVRDIVIDEPVIYMGMVS